MRCPTCKKEFHPQPDHFATYSPHEKALKKSKKASHGALDSIQDTLSNMMVSRCRFSIQECPACKEIIVIREAGRGLVSDKSQILTTSTEIIYPQNKSIKINQEVPDDYRDDFLEAHAASDYSAKASAALSRRLLQKIFREKLGIKKRDLSQEIEEFVSNAHAPSYLTDAVDAIRQIGNFAAHPIKYENSGEIVEVESGEAEWLLEVLESLFDFVFVQPTKLAQRRITLNQKLKALGKPELKGS
ncbi:protein of unknown function [Thiothrix caldifontis]|uniref:DUF4145 domain-containing protein n=1 Tax=Thiothrix caldifontis TaxID=525918 RepID=A0A1H4AV95_9GAMM|nr:DUF4145 domain-containing protein [Thiothrix caldifontis]SEA39845.1 protein of unknown function [Thiothrix caldifontis]